MSDQDIDIFGRYISNNEYGPSPQLMGVNKLIGNDVYSPNNEDLGYVKEIMLDTYTGEVRYAVLSYGGFFGMGEKLFAVPWEALKLDAENKKLMLDLSSTILDSSSGFNKYHWPSKADERLAKNSHENYHYY